MSHDVDSIDYKINNFLDFWENHGRDPDELRVDGWVMFTPGCDGDFGCCSKTHDLAGLVDALYELTGREEPPFTKETADAEQTDQNQNIQTDPVPSPKEGDAAPSDG